MSAVDDVRKAIQDFLAPELRTIYARLDSIEKVMDVKFETVEVKLDSLSKQIQAVDNKLDIERRLPKLEARQAATQHLTPPASPPPKSNPADSRSIPGPPLCSLCPLW